MLICDLRGIINDVKMMRLEKDLLYEILNIKKKQNISLASLIYNGHLLINSEQMEIYYQKRGIITNKNTEFIVTALESDYYGDGYSFFRTGLDKISIKKNNFVNINNDDEYLLLEITHQIGLFHQYQIDLNMNDFEKNLLTMKTDTIFSKPVIKMCTNMYYNDLRIKKRNSGGFEKKIFQCAIIKTKKKSLFNKSTFKQVVEVSSINL